MAGTTPEKQPRAVLVANKLDKLTKTDRITWGNEGDWRRHRVVVHEPGASLASIRVFTPRLPTS